MKDLFCLPETRNRILLLDGGMGSLIQERRLSEKDFRGSRFRDHPLPLAGLNDLLCLTMPGFIASIHRAYLEAGADIIETCSFNATTVSLEAFGLGDCSYEINAAAASLARLEADRLGSPQKPRFVAGSMGPTARGAGIASSMADPSARAIGWDELEKAYYEAARGLWDGGVDMFLVETIFDGINAKAALAALIRLFRERGNAKPVMLSMTLTKQGRLLDGQTVEAFAAAAVHGKPVSLGFNCSFGAEKLLAPARTLASWAPAAVCIYPNAGLPNTNGGYDETPSMMALAMEPYLEEGLVNIIGGCCGTTPEHIAALAVAAKKFRPRVIPAAGAERRLSGLELSAARLEGAALAPGVKVRNAGGAESGDVLAKLVRAGDYEEAADLIRKTAEDADIVSFSVDGAFGPPPAVSAAAQAMTKLVRFALFYPDTAKLPVMIESASWEIAAAGLKCLPGTGLLNANNIKLPQDELERRCECLGAIPVKL